MSTLELKELSHPAGEVLKIAAGKTLDLNSQGTVILPEIPLNKIPVLTLDKMPAGIVLKVESIVENGMITVSNSAMTTLTTYTFVPVRSGSKFFISYYLYANWGATNHGFGAYMYKDGTQVHASGNSHSIYANQLADVYMGGSWSFLETYGSTAGTGIVFELKGNPYKGHAINFSGSGQTRGFTIMEIAQ